MLTLVKQMFVSDQENNADGMVLSVAVLLSLTAVISPMPTNVLQEPA